MKKDNFLLYKPVKKHSDWEIKNGLVYLNFYHEKKIEKFLRWLVKKPYKSDIELDKIGSEVWKLIDGNNTIHDIIEIVSKKFNIDKKDMISRMVLYIRYLARKNWITFSK